LTKLLPLRPAGFFAPPSPESGGAATTATTAAGGGPIIEVLVDCCMHIPVTSFQDVFGGELRSASDAAKLLHHHLFVLFGWLPAPETSRGLPARRG